MRTISREAPGEAQRWGLGREAGSGQPSSEAQVSGEMAI